MHMNSLSKEDRQKIYESTSWLPRSFSLKARYIVLQNNYTIETFPTCPICNNQVKEHNGKLTTFCSDKCSKEYKKQQIKQELLNYNWLYEHRINLQLSFEEIAKIVNCSVTPIKEACKRLKIPQVKYNESNALTNSFLRNKEWLYQEHVVNKRKIEDIAKEINSSKPTVSRWLNFHEIITNNPNSYDRLNISSSKEEKELVDYISSLGIRCELGNRSILDGLEIDIIIPEFKLAIEYNGVYSHIFRPEENNFSKRKDRNYHLTKTLKAQEKGWNLIHLFSDDWILRKNICKSIISYKLSKCFKIYGRKCIIKEVSPSEKKIFLNENHIQGNDKSNLNIGLFYNDELVSLMTFCKSRYNKKYDWELSRFCNKNFTAVIGGFSRLLKYFKSLYPNESIISYADRTRSNGAVYYKNGFKLLKINPPGYQYVNLNKSIQRMHRSNFTKDKIKGDKSKTEFELMEELGYHRIYDCGTLTFIIDK